MGMPTTMRRKRRLLLLANAPGEFCEKGGYYL
jgi:hypothetical protein